MAELLPALLERFGAKPRTMLDLACGEGTFAVAMAKKGVQVTGVDLSPRLLEFARKHAEKENVAVEFLCQDMCSLNFKERFDLVTCWYDSLNYLLESEQLEKTFTGVHRALKDGGLFIFDMNTIYGLSLIWQRHPCYVQQDTPELFEVHCPSYDSEKKIATLRIIGFIKEKNGWTRIDEEHKERGYSIAEIRESLKRSDLRELACWGNIQEMSEPKPDSGRVWFITKTG